MTCTNCIFWGNQDESGFTETAQITSDGEPATLNYSCVMDWSGALGGIGNIGDDPLFVDADGPDGIPGTSDDNVRLSPDSPCIDTGDNDAVPEDVTTDFEGDPRIQDCRVDMGVDETPYVGSDCNTNGTGDACDVIEGTSPDCNGNLLPDECEPGGLEDCNVNAIPDLCDIYAGTSLDCNGNAVPDACDVTDGTSSDCNENDTPDECEPGGLEDCNTNEVPDLCDVYTGASEDCNGTGVPDECEPGGVDDCNTNGASDLCDLYVGTSADCNDNGVPDECDTAGGFSGDCNENSVPDECEDTSADCNDNGFWDTCDVAEGTSPDCNANGLPDECDVAGGTSADCNHNIIPDACDIAEGTSHDLNEDGFPDDCDPGDPLPASYPHNRAKNRYISFASNPDNDNLSIAFRIELKSLTLGSCSGNGAPCRLDLGSADCGACSVTGAPCINAAVDCVPAGQSCDPTGETCVNDLTGSAGLHWWVGPESALQNGVHPLVSEPYRREDLGSAWNTVVHVADCEVVPRGVYGVRAVNADTGIESPELEVITIARPGENYWADAVGPLGQYCTGNWAECPDGDSDCPPGESCLEQWSPPDGFVNFNDVAAAVFAFSQVPGMTLPGIMVVDMHGNDAGDANVDPPNFVVNFADIGFIVLAFQSRPYPFSDPADCPDIGY